MSQNPMHTSRIDARVPFSVKETIDRAAAIQGRSRTDFLIEAALEKAERVIADQAILRLTMRDQELLAKALEAKDTPEPGAYAARLSKEYAERVTSV